MPDPWQTTHAGKAFEIKVWWALLGKWVFVLLSIGLFVMMIHPSSFDRADVRFGPSAWLGVLLSALPTPFQILVALIFECYFILELVSLYIPAWKYSSMIIFDEKSVYGFDLLGRVRPLRISDIEKTFSAFGSIFIQGSGTWIRIPLPILSLSFSDKVGIRALLKSAICHR